LLTGVSTSVRRLFAPGKGLPDSIVPIRQHGVQGQVLAITPLLPYQNINASQHTVSPSRGVVTQCPVSLAFLSSASFPWGRIAARKRARSLPLARIGRLRSRVKTHALGACGRSTGRVTCGQEGAAAQRRTQRVLSPSRVRGCARSLRQCKQPPASRSTGVERG
jgi:hypothetical protein